MPALAPVAAGMRWVNDQKRRYYQAVLVVDLFGSWVLVTAWGGLDSQRGNMRSTLVESHADGLAHIQALDRRRRQRGYRPADPAPTASPDP
jgi:hypothetical protein